jgi:carboxypeptidase family protein
MRPNRLTWIVGTVLTALLVLAGSVLPGSAQTLTGSLSGTVVDSSDAILPGATVTLVNELSGDQRATVTNDAGNFVFAAVQAGTYTVKVELSGFQTVETKGIVLRLGEKRNLTGIKMGVAGVTEQVAVTAVSELAPVSSGEKSATITGEQIQNIAIVGRSAAELLKILPGMVALVDGNSASKSNGAPGFNGEVYGINGNGEGGKQSAIGNYSSNGTQSNALDIVIDGAHGTDPGCNCATSVNPNPDMVGEFKVLQANFGAENAKGPTTINVVSKAGGRDFRGTAYLYARNYRWNSNEWFLNKVDDAASGPQNRPKNKFYFPGFNIGGPLLIPGTDFNKNRDKLFFFFGYEFYKQDLDTGTLKSWVPTQAMRNGDFSDAAYLAKLGDGGSQPFANLGGHVPADQIDHNGQVLLNLLPLPNIDPAQGLGYNYVQNVPLSQNNHQSLGRVDWSLSDNTKMFFKYNFQAERQPFPVGLWWRNANQVPYPTPVVADNRSHSTTASLTKVFSSSLTSETTFGLTYINFPNALEDPSKVSRSALGYTNPGIYKNGLDQIPSWVTWGDSATMFNPGGFDPVLFAKKWLVSISQNVTKVSGAHTIKAGFYYEWVNNDQPGNDNSNGQIESASWAGGSTGNAFADLLTGRMNSYNESTKNVLHNLGYNVVEGYAQDSYKIKPRVTLEYGLRLSHLGNWYDREGIGIAAFDVTKYDPNASLADRSGLTYNKIDGNTPLSGAPSRSLFWAPRVGAAWDLQGTGQTVVRGGYGMFIYHDEQGPFSGMLDVPAGHVATTQCCGLLLNNVPGIVPGVAKIGLTAIDPNDDLQPRTQSWSLTVQRRLPWNLTYETSYVGSKSDHLRNDGLANINTVPLGAMLHDPTGNADNYRPFQLWGGINLTTHTLYSNYHSWQNLVSRQTGKFSFTGAYTLSKALGIRGSAQGQSIQPPTIGQLREFAYGVLGNDRRHVLSFAYSWNLPQVSTGVTNAVLGNWQISGISQFLSGVPLQVTGGNGNFRIDGTAADGTPLNPTNITGSPEILVYPVLTCDPRGSGDTLINANCFAAPTAGSNGNFVFPNATGAWYFNHDFSLFKNFPFGGGAKKFQFRFSAYNVFNHPQRQMDDNNNLNLHFTNGVQDNAGFGVLPTDNKYGRRIIQLAFKFYF